MIKKLLCKLSLDAVFLGIPRLPGGSVQLSPAEPATLAPTLFHISPAGISDFQFVGEQDYSWCQDKPLLEFFEFLLFLPPSTENQCSGLLVMFGPKESMKVW